MRLGLTRRHKFQKRLLAIAIAIAAGIGHLPVAAADGIALFEQFIAHHPQMAMPFRQTAVNADGSEGAAVDGQLWFTAPRAFRLQYSDAALPLMVSDGENGIWFYEPDIVQAVLHPQGDTRQFGLLAVFGGGGLDALRASHILTTGRDARWQWLVAEARDESQSIRKIRLGWTANDDTGAADAKQLRRIFIHDAFGGQVRIEVGRITQPPPDAARYIFTPPAGVDVIYADASGQ